MRTNSISFPNMFDVARNSVGLLEDDVSVVNRTRLLFLTDPTELYDNPNFGLGLRRYLWQYNNDAVKPMIQERIKDQLTLYEPCVDPESTSFVDGLLFTGRGEVVGREPDQLKFTVGLRTIFNDQVDIELEVTPDEFLKTE